MYSVIKFLLRLAFGIAYSLHYEGRENIPKGTAVIYASNHRTNADPPLVGAGARVLGPFKVGDNARIAAGAVVLTEVPENATAVGVPAKIVRINGEKPKCQELDQIHITDPVAQRFCTLEAEIEILKQELEELKRKENAK